MLAIEQARRSVGAGHRVLLLCFNRPLSKWLAAEAEGTTVLTLHEYMRRIVGAEFTEEKLHESAFWEDELPVLALERLAEGGGEAFDELILDEGQDMLRESWLDVLDLSLAGGLAEGRFRIFGDFAHQAIYDAAVMSVDDLQGRCRGAVIADLKVNCRNTPRVAALARGCDEVEWGRVLRADDGVDPVLRFYRDTEQQCELLEEALRALRDQGFTGPQVAVLSPHKDSACAAAELCGLTGGVGGAAEATVPGRPWRDRLAPLVPPGQFEPDLRSGKTKYASVYRFKGLEARAVVLTDIDRLESPHEHDLFYIGATRATQRLIVLADESLRPQLRPAE